MVKHSYEYWNFYEQATSFLAKIRGTIPQKIESEVTVLKENDFLIWPAEFLINKLSPQVAKQIRDDFSNYDFSQHGTRCIHISYEDYDKVRSDINQDRLDTPLIDALKQYFALRKLEIIVKDKPDTIYLTHRDPIGNYTTGADLLQDASITNRGDMLFSVTSPASGKLVKFPAYFLPDIIPFYKLEDFKVNTMPRETVQGKATSKSSIRTRMLVREKDEDDFIRIYTTSYLNIMRGVEDMDALSHLKHRMKEYEEIKQDPSWRKGI